MGIDRERQNRVLGVGYHRLLWSSASRAAIATARPPIFVLHLTTVTLKRSVFIIIIIEDKRLMTSRTMAVVRLVRARTVVRIRSRTLNANQHQPLLPEPVQ